MVHDPSLLLAFLVSFRRHDRVASLHPLVDLIFLGLPKTAHAMSGHRMLVDPAVNGGGNADLPQNSLKAHAPRNSLIINAEIISHNHFPPTRPEKRFSPLISQHRTRVTGLQ